MANRSLLWTAAMAAAALAGPVAAQTVRESTTTTTTEIRKGSALMNVNVAVEGGATVGRVTDFVISDGGCIEYVVVESDSRFMLVPFQVVQFDPGRRIVSVNVSRDAWRNIPTFTGTNWPVHDQNYISRVRSTFGVRESGYRGDRDRQPLTPGQDRRDDRRQDRRDDRGTQPPPRPGVDNPTRPGNAPPGGTNPPPGSNRPADNTGRNPPPPDRDPNRDRRNPPPPPPGTPGTDRPPA
jgi:hypothetical protein